MTAPPPSAPLPPRAVERADSEPPGPGRAGPEPPGPEPPPIPAAAGEAPRPPAGDTGFECSANSNPRRAVPRQTRRSGGGRPPQWTRRFPSRSHVFPAPRGGCPPARGFGRPCCPAGLGGAHTPPPSGGAVPPAPPPACAAARTPWPVPAAAAAAPAVPAFEVLYPSWRRFSFIGQFGKPRGHKASARQRASKNEYPPRCFGFRYSSKLRPMSNKHLGRKTATVEGSRWDSHAHEYTGSFHAEPVCAAADGRDNFCPMPAFQGRMVFLNKNIGRMLLLSPNRPNRRFTAFPACYS